MKAGTSGIADTAPSLRRGEFYEIVGPDALAHAPIDWQSTNHVNAGKRHFLFYLRDGTFECFADAWAFSPRA
jgi:hypothetical protein